MCATLATLIALSFYKALKESKVCYFCYLTQFLHTNILKLLSKFQLEFVEYQKCATFATWPTYFSQNLGKMKSVLLLLLFLLNIFRQVQKVIESVLLLLLGLLFSYLNILQSYLSIVLWQIEKMCYICYFTYYIFLCTFHIQMAVKRLKSLENVLQLLLWLLFSSFEY